jgi:hypothetical protein
MAAHVVTQYQLHTSMNYRRYNKDVHTSHQEHFPDHMDKF